MRDPDSRRRRLLWVADLAAPVGLRSRRRRSSTTSRAVEADDELQARVADADPAARRAPAPRGARSPAARSASTRSTSPATTTACSTLLQRRAPDAVVHFAEQRAAPYSMKSSWHKRYTVDNNTSATHNLLARDRGVRPRHPRRPPRDDGRLRLRHRRHAAARGLPDRAHGRRGRRRGRAGDPLPRQPGLGLPPDQDPGPADVRVLRQERRAAHHRPAPGHRVGHADAGDRARRAPDQPLRLRRRLRHRPQPLPHAGGDRLPADRPRHGRPDARLHPHPRHGEVHPARARDPAGARRARRASSTR